MATPVLLCLHGWGGTKESFTELRVALGNDMEILTPDLPGFGESPEPDRPWNIDDCADWVESYVREHVHGPLLLLGHSHGGRIAIKIATRGKLPIEHLFLCAAAGIKHRKPIRRSVGFFLAKVGKFFFSIPGLRWLQPLASKVLYKLLRVHDYEKASPVMKETFKNVTGIDIRPLLPEISVPTDIFWGEDDTMTPISDGVAMHKAIDGSQFHRYAGVRHRVHRDRAEEIAKVIRATISAL